MSRPLLTRVVPIRYPLGSAADRVANAIRVTSICFVLGSAIAVLVPRRRFTHCYSSRHDTTVRLLHEYADSAYLAWMRDNPTTQCPSTLAELNPYTNKKGSDTKDQWGTDMRLQCPPPPGAGTCGPPVPTDASAPRMTSRATHRERPPTPSRIIRYGR